MTDPVLKTDEARQGETGHNVRWVLIAGTAGAAVVLAIVVGVFLS